MPKFRVLTKSFIGNSLLEEGAIVDFDGVPGPNLEPLDAPAQTAAEQFAATAAGDLARQKAAAAGAEPDAAAAAAAISAAAEAAQKTLAAASNDAAKGLV